MKPWNGRRPMNAVDVISAAQGQIEDLALVSLRGERNAARDIAVRLECENARLLDVVKKAARDLRVFADRPGLTILAGNKIQNIATDLEALL